MDLVLSSALDMAAERKPRIQGATWNIDEDARLAIIERMDSKGISRADLARACNVTASAITLLLAKPIPRGGTRGCKFLARIEKTLGTVPTPKSPVIVEKSDHARRALKLLDALQNDAEALELWIRTGEMMVG